MCRNGEVLSSPALNYNLLHLSAAVEQQKQNKLLKESPEEEGDNKNSEVCLEKINWYAIFMGFIVDGSCTDAGAQRHANGPGRQSEALPYWRFCLYYSP